MANSTWMRLPSRWIDDHGLTQLSWSHAGGGSDNTAALMALTVIAHEIESETGVARITYDRICDLTGLSRAKLANGLNILKQIGVINSESQVARSTYTLSHYNEGAWGKFPVKSMYSSGRIVAFDELRLRRVVELDALKLFFCSSHAATSEQILPTLGMKRLRSIRGSSVFASKVRSASLHHCRSSMSSIFRVKAALTEFRTLTESWA
jgi:hypothetical protein